MENEERISNSGLGMAGRYYPEVSSESQRVFYSCIDVLNSIIEKKSEESYSHIHVVSKMMELLLKKARELFPEIGYSDEMISCLCDATLLHDVGKIMVPDRILNKQGYLTAEEFVEMKMHTIYGADLIRKLPCVSGEEQTIQYAIEIALHHHERVDGKGYPEGLHEDQIPFYVQVASLADVYEALTARRVYKGPFSHEVAIEMIQKGDCGAFSDRILECLAQTKDELAKIRMDMRY